VWRWRGRPFIIDGVWWCLIVISTDEYATQYYSLTWWTNLQETYSARFSIEFFHTTIKQVKFLDQKLLKSAIIYCSEVQWYLMCTKVVRHIRAVLFWIIYYGIALSKPRYYVLVKQLITFLFSWKGGAALSPGPTPFCSWTSNFDSSCA